MRNYNISVIRGIAVCMIVSCHIFQGLHIELAYWMNVGVQIFLCMSGYLYGKKSIGNTKKWYIRRYLKIMIPMWVMLTFLLLTLKFTHTSSYSKFSAIASYLGIAGFQTIPELTHTWFITYILFCYLITPLLEKIDITNNTSQLKFTVNLVGIIVCLEFLYVGKIIGMLPQYVSVYIIGYYIARNEYMNGERTRNIYLKLFGILTIILFPVRLLVQYGHLKINNAYWEILRGQIMDWHHLLIGISLFLVMLTFFEKRKIKSNKLIDWLDNYSYYIYLVHQIFILNTFSLLRITDFLILNIAIIIFLIIIASVILERITHIINKKLETRGICNVETHGR